MLKYLLLAAALAWLYYSPAVRAWRGRPPEPPRAPPGPKAPPRQEVMVRCAHCGVHLPESDALKDPHGLPYCSMAHREAGPRQA